MILPAVISVIVVGLSIITTASFLLFIYWKRRGSSLPHLDKHHKESEENSYASSKNSRDSSPKGAADSFNPVYDEIKLKVSPHQKESVIKENCKSCRDDNELDDPHYFTVYSTVSEQHKKEEVCYRSNHAGNQQSKGHKNSITSREDIKDQPLSHDTASINNYCANDDTDKDKSKNYEIHTYTLVDPKKKKTEDNMNNYHQEACTPGSDGGTPPPVPPHTPEMLLNDSDPNRHDERPQVETNTEQTV